MFPMKSKLFLQVGMRLPRGTDRYRSEDDTDNGERGDYRDRMRERRPPADCSASAASRARRSLSRL